MSIYTTELNDKCIILFACLSVYLLQTTIEISVLPLIISIIIWSLASYFDRLLVKRFLYIAFFILCFFIPELIIFVPLLFYDISLKIEQIGVLLFTLPIINSWSYYTYTTIGIIIGLSVMAIALKYRSSALYKQKSQYNKLADNAREMSTKLKLQNKALLEKYDTDINLATLSERNRIAREIHDHVGHQLSSAILQIGALITVSNEGNLKEPLKTVNVTLTEAMNSIRNSIHDLHDKSIDLHMQIKSIVNSFTFCEINFDDGLNTQPSKAARMAIISIIKEALSNIIKHSDATHVIIKLREHPAFYQFIIRDNGKKKSVDTKNGIGLTNMIDRVQSLKGIINFRVDKGFEIFISIPKEG
ncbi:UNVERIFIED_CONTAM: signal transduction histidine kinase [Acetivibrio alkalicellulosi]